MLPPVPQVPTLAPSDSGFYSHGNPSSVQVLYVFISIFSTFSTQFQNSVNSSFVTVDSESDLGGECSVSRGGHGSRRLSSNADMPDYGSWCSLQRRVMSMVDSSLSPMTQFSSQPNMVAMVQAGTNPSLRSASLCQNESLRYLTP